MDGNLIGYLLNSLDPQERSRTEAYLRDNADARRKLASLKAALAPLGAARDLPDPPPRLVERTLARAFGASPVTLSRESADTPSRWRRIDALVACCILVLMCCH